MQTNCCCVPFLIHLYCHKIDYSWEVDEYVVVIMIMINKAIYMNDTIFRLILIIIVIISQKLNNRMDERSFCWCGHGRYSNKKDSFGHGWCQNMQIFVNACVRNKRKHELVIKVN